MSRRDPGPAPIEARMALIVLWWLVLLAYVLGLAGWTWDWVGHLGGGNTGTAHMDGVAGRRSATGSRSCGDEIPSARVIQSADAAA
jgi:hypothetical protein